MLTTHERIVQKLRAAVVVETRSFEDDQCFCMVNFLGRCLWSCDGPRVDTTRSAQQFAVDFRERLTKLVEVA